MYRIVIIFPIRTGSLTDALRAYTRHEIDVAWPKQQKGINARSGGTGSWTSFIARYAPEPVTEAQKSCMAKRFRRSAT